MVLESTFNCISALLSLEASRPKPMSYTALLHLKKEESRLVQHWVWTPGNLRSLFCGVYFCLYYSAFPPSYVVTEEIYVH